MIEMELLRKGDLQNNKLLRQSRVIAKRRARRSSKGHARSSSEA
jgi:hypothetical protein